MKRFLTFLMVFALLILESTLFSKLSIRGITPNLSCILVVSYGLLGGNSLGRAVGFFVGLTQDMLFSTSVGFFALLYFYIGHLSGYGHRILRKGNYITPLFCVLLGDLLYGLCCYFFKYFLAGQIDFRYYLFRVILPEASYTALIALPLFAFLRRMDGTFTRIQRKLAASHEMMKRERM